MLKTPVQIRQHVIDTIGASAANLLGTRTYGATVEPAITIVPDPQYEESGLSFPSIVNGYPVTYQGIEVVIYDGYEANQYTPMFANQSRLDKQIWILIKSHDLVANTVFEEAAHLISKGLYIVSTRTPVDTFGGGNVDQIPVLKVQILEVGFAGYR